MSDQRRGNQNVTVQMKTVHGQRRGDGELVLGSLHEPRDSRDGLRSRVHGSRDKIDGIKNKVHGSRSKTTSTGSLSVFLPEQLSGSSSFVRSMGTPARTGSRSQCPTRARWIWPRSFWKRATTRCGCTGLGARDSLRLEAGPLPLRQRLERGHHARRGRAQLDDRQAAPGRRVAASWALTSS